MERAFEAYGDDAYARTGLLVQCLGDLVGSCRFQFLE